MGNCGNCGNSTNRSISRKVEAQTSLSSVLRLPAVLPRQSSDLSSAVKKISHPSSATTIPNLPDVILKRPSSPQIAPNQYLPFSSDSNTFKVSTTGHDNPQPTSEQPLQSTPIDVSMDGKILTTVATESAENLRIGTEPMLLPKSDEHSEEPDDKNYDLDPIILIFLDKNAHDRTYRTMFEKIEHRRLFYSDPIVCMNDSRWTSDIDKKIFLITSGSMLTMLDMDINQITSKHPNIDSVFIFCVKRERYEYLLDKDQQPHRRPTLKGIFTDYDSLFNSIEDNFTFLQSHLRALQNFSYRKQFRLIDQYRGDICSFFLMKILLTDMPNTEAAKSEMLRLCRDYFCYNATQLNQIENFQDHYEQSKVIWWFTSDSFFYRLLNMALQSENIRLMYTFRFLIRDLSHQLNDFQFFKGGTAERHPIQVYRGVLMLETELNALKEGIGRSFLVNGYLSASLDRQVAYAYLQTDRENMVSVLFEIDVDPHRASCVFADISTTSAFQSEKEVLFDIGLVLQVVKVTIADDDYRKIRIIRMINTDSDFIERECWKYINVMQSLENCSACVFFGKIIQTLGMCTWSREYFEELLSATTIDPQDESSIRCILNRQSRFLNNVEDAEKHNLLSESPEILNARGELLEFGGELNRVGDTYEKALLAISSSKLEERRKQFVLAAVYMNIAGKMMEEGAYDSALERYKQSEKRYIELFSPTHPLLADVWIALGNLYRKKNEITQALSYYEEAHMMYQQWLPSHHPSIAYALSHLGLAHHRNGSLDEAHKLYQQAFQIYSEALPPEHPNVQLSRYNGHCSNYQFALDYYIKYPCF